MNSHTRRRVLIAAVLVILALTLWWWRSQGPSQPAITPLPEPVPVPAPIPKFVPPEAPKPVAPKPSVKPIPTPLPPPVTPPVPPKPPEVTTPPAPVSTTVPKPPSIQLHKELIPKGIEIVRCYYDREIMGPETTFGFDINGSGFTTDFKDMITVDPGGLDIQVKNLHLITANQIHGDLVVGSAQTTEFIYPKVLIQGKPVFRASDPFAVVRPGEVLVIVFVSLADDGRSGRFRVITNLDETMAKQFRVVPTNPGLEISPLEFHLPFAVEGIMQITAGVPQGEYGLAAYIGQHHVWERKGIIRIVKPNIGLTGFVQGVSAVDKFHRPGDTAQFYLHGSGLTQAYTTALSAKVNEMDMGPANFQFVSAAQMRFSLQIPGNAPLRTYGINILDQKGNSLFKKDDVFQLVPPNWISGVQVAPPPHPGQQGLLRIIGRDLAPNFAQSLALEVDEPGISIKNLRPLDNNTLAADIAVSSTVAPGDYWIHLTSDGKVIQPPYGSIIKIEAP
jgi:hypothetical protein